VYPVNGYVLKVYAGSPVIFENGILYFVPIIKDIPNNDRRVVYVRIINVCFFTIITLFDNY